MEDYSDTYEQAHGNEKFVMYCREFLSLVHLAKQSLFGLAFLCLAK